MNEHAFRSNPPPGLVLRPAKPADAPLLCEFVRELAYFEGLAHECHITVDSAFEHLLGPRRVADAIIAELGGQPVGYAVFYRTLSTFVAKPGIYLEDLFVRPAYRQQGIGRALLHEVGRLAHRADSGRFEWVALKWNEKARSLYRAAGAREMEEWVLLRMNEKALAKFACEGPRGGADLVASAEH